MAGEGRLANKKIH